MDSKTNKFEERYKKCVYDDNRKSQMLIVRATRMINEDGSATSFIDLRNTLDGFPFNGVFLRAYKFRWLTQEFTKSLAGEKQWGRRELKFMAGHRFGSTIVALKKSNGDITNAFITQSQKKQILEMKANLIGALRDYDVDSDDSESENVFQPRVQESFDTVDSL